MMLFPSADPLGHVLEDLLFERELRYQPLELSILLFQLIEPLGLVELIDRVELRADDMSVTLAIQAPGLRAGVRTIGFLTLSRVLPLKMKRRGVEARVIIAAAEKATCSKL